MNDREPPNFLYAQDADGEWWARVLGPVDDATRTELEARLNTPERRSLAATLRVVTMRGEPAYGIADALPDDAVAVIVREPVEGPRGRLILFDADSLSDDIVARARGALMQSEVAEPRVAERRVITLWRDGRYEVREGARHATGRRAGEGPSRATGAADQLRASTEAVEGVHVPEVGLVRLARHGGRAGDAG